MRLFYSRARMQIAVENESRLEIMQILVQNNTKKNNRKSFTASGFWQERSKMYLDGGRKKIDQTSFISVEKIVTISWNWLQLNPPILLRQIWFWRDFTQCLAPILLEANIYCLWLSTNAPNLRKKTKKYSKLGVPHQECLRFFISKKCFDHQEIPLDCYEKSTFNNCFRNNPFKK